MREGSGLLPIRKVERRSRCEVRVAKRTVEILGAPRTGYTCTLSMWLFFELVHTRPQSAARPDRNGLRELIDPSCKCARVNFSRTFRTGSRPDTVERVERRSKSTVRIAKRTIQILGAPRTGYEYDISAHDRNCAHRSACVLITVVAPTGLSRFPDKRVDRRRERKGTPTTSRAASGFPAVSVRRWRVKPSGETPCAPPS